MLQVRIQRLIGSVVNEKNEKCSTGKLEEQVILEVTCGDNFSFKTFLSEFAQNGSLEKNLTGGKNTLRINFLIPELETIESLKQLSLKSEHNLLDLSIQELNQISILKLSEVSLVASYLTHEYCHLYGSIGIGINQAFEREEYVLVTVHSKGVVGDRV